MINKILFSLAVIATIPAHAGNKKALAKGAGGLFLCGIAIEDANHTLAQLDTHKFSYPWVYNPITYLAIDIGLLVGGLYLLNECRKDLQRSWQESSTLIENAKNSHQQSYKNPS